MSILANPGTVLFSCLTVVVGELSSLFFMAFWMVLFMRQGSSTANLAASNQSGFFWQRSNSSQSGLRQLDFVPDGLERHFGPPKLNGHPFFPLLRSVCSSLHTWLSSTGKCNLGSCIILISKTVFHWLEWWKLVWNIPINRRTKCNCPQGHSSTRKARGTKFVLVMFYCSDCNWHFSIYNATQCFLTLVNTSNWLQCRKRRVNQIVTKVSTYYFTTSWLSKQNPRHAKETFVECTVSAHLFGFFCIW